MTQLATLGRTEIAARAARYARVDTLTPGTQPVDGLPRMLLGSHRAPWVELSPAPMFTATKHFARYVDSGNEARVPKAQDGGSWDSGGFTELADHGDWRVGPDEFGGQVTRLMIDIGRPGSVASMDFMCEPIVIMGGTFKDRRFVGTDWGRRYGFDAAVELHLQWTVDHYVYLVEQFPHIPWMPVIQGWTLQQYLRCIDLYAAAGVDLTRCAVVGVGSVCRRQATQEIAEIMAAIARLGIRIHGFGVKTDGLSLYGRDLYSFDSMAWSDVARKETIRLPDCIHVGDCRNCLIWALVWRERVLKRLRESVYGPTPARRSRSFGPAA